MKTSKSLHILPILVLPALISFPLFLIGKPANTKSLSIDIRKPLPISCVLSFTTEEMASKAMIAVKKEFGLESKLDAGSGGSGLPWLVEVFPKDKKIREKIKQRAPSWGALFDDCKPRPSRIFQVDDKPVIYLYPPHPQEVWVQLEYRGSFTVTYPDYDPLLKGWKVMAYPDGHLINSSDGLEYSYLFWEGVDAVEKDYDFSKGFVVEGPKTRSFLQETLKKMGLTPREYNEFIVYWLPRMQENRYNLIHFAQEEYTDRAPLHIRPAPDSLLRIFMVFQALEQPISVTPQPLKSFERKGFTVVEWGGKEIKKK